MNQTKFKLYDLIEEWCTLHYKLETTSNKAESNDLIIELDRIKSEIDIERERIGAVYI